MSAGIAATAALSAVLIVGSAGVASAQAAPAGQPAAKQKQAKDQGEYDLANGVVIDMSGSNWQKTIA
ncbi:MAG TPA: hypothetical protein VMU19_10290, partial [Bryobacteraceae bacterium]|nr:hypothetical protein [Bryobacteraceae bacterium]